jgi:hypothetical protein
VNKLLPLIFLLVGTGAGVGAGIFLRPDTVADPVVLSDENTTKKDRKDEAEEDISDIVSTDSSVGDKSKNEFAKLNNQFVIPLVVGERVTALVVLALSVEVPEGETATVYLREPKLRDSFLQVLFDHANMGGFEGNFTSADALGRLRGALREVGQKDLGADLIKDVLIMEIARQDY